MKMEKERVGRRAEWMERKDKVGRNASPITGLDKADCRSESDVADCRSTPAPPSGQTLATTNAVDRPMCIGHRARVRYKCKAGQDVIRRGQVSDTISNQSNRQGQQGTRVCRRRRTRKCL